MSTEDQSSRLPPHELDAERGVLGSMWIDRAALDLCASRLNESVFYGDSNRIIFSAMVRLTARGVPVDAVTLLDELVKSNDLESVGGVAYLMSVVEGVPTSAHAKYYADIVQKAYDRRQLIGLCRASVDDCYEKSVEFESIVAKLNGGLQSVISHHASELQSATDVLSDMRDPSRRNARRYGTGLPEVDKILLSGVKESHFVVVAACPSMGKTAFGIQWVENVAKQGTAAVFVSLEMENVEIFERIESQGVGRADDFAKLPVLFSDTAVNLDHVVNVIRMAHSRMQIRVAVVDYIQLISSDSRMPKHERLEHMTLTLKRLAKELKIVVIALSQLNREGSKRPDKRPVLTDLKGSSAIGEQADEVLMLHRPEYYDADDRPGEAEVIISKHRSGPCGRADVGFIKRKTLFVPYDERPIGVGSYFGTEVGETKAPY